MRKKLLLRYSEAGILLIRAFHWRLSRDGGVPYLSDLYWYLVHKRIMGSNAEVRSRTKSVYNKNKKDHITEYRKMHH